ncbi:DUF6517 family protein [Candidatus Halobonum tyrrellensis]|uniref:Lipoprotein n=1 Tax=Candidatus Halobonum tyrrellensis G22 TaxID=1324957 RepID=V4H976_9EURY|nr:DUF6517 family protein [Candidatus Halobonum tyrrellensis]ESP87270.1 hypothetical protein K933_14328 [Candidatus Halobonum tyrrellensis G22]
MHRRRFLAGAAVAGAAGLAGCGTASGAPRPPSLPDERLDDGGWERTTETEQALFSETVAGAEVSATAVTRVYDDAALRATVSERTLGAVDAPLATFFASRVTFRPNIAEVPLESAREQLAARAAEAARAEFEAQLRAAGLSDVTPADGGTTTVATGESADRTDYTAAFAFDDLSFPVGERDLTVEGGEVAVAGFLAAWVHDGGLLIAGGAHPAENFARTVERDLSDSIAVTVDVDLGLTPEAYAADLNALVTNVG